MKIQSIIVLLLCLTIYYSWCQPTSGIFTIGLISWPYTDSSAAQDKYVNRALNELKESSASDLFFTADECMSVAKVNSAIKKIIYDNKNNIQYTVMEKGKMKWYAIDTLPASIFRRSDTTSTDVSDLHYFQVSALPDDQKTIFGFICNKVTFQTPEAPGQKIIFYRTNKILASEEIDPVSKFIPGFTLEKTFIGYPGFTPTMEAAFFTPKKFRKQHFGINFKKYKRVTPAELELEIWDLK